MAGLVFLRLLLLFLLQCLTHLQAEIAHTPLASNRIRLEPEPELDSEETHVLPASCPQRMAYEKMLNSIDDVEDLYVDVPVHIALEQRQKKRFVLKLNNSTPLMILFSMPVARKIYYNQTANLLRLPAQAKGPATDRLVLPCALRGQYDLFVRARQGGALKLEAQAKHPDQSWPLLNHTHRIAIRTQNRVRKRQLIVKWERSYCVIVFNLPQRSSADYTNYCMDFGASRITEHKNFKYIRCREKQPSNVDKLETETILSLSPGDSYLIYVTANLSMGKPLPYQTLTVHMGSQCVDLESQEQPEYY
ncbi:uncharacterized protein Dvir_GJ21584, isoform D [Drosophila virilis]|uniref:Uncharacterized protein, isoform D n=1 Tax=Drosophila virilis TaxID=7244 RepID=A0A0Q9WDT7_DROVI|nr:uncharacterized protein Dvir_GJ21584, isoform D [Drosophila virilis]